MELRKKAFLKSIWVFHLSAGSCNNCDIEIFDCFTPRFDVERLGIQLAGSVRHADALLVTGVINKKTIPIVKKIYAQAPKPCLVIACGICANSQHMFRFSYNVDNPLDKILPVDVYIPGCPPKPEAIIAGIAKLIDKISKGEENASLRPRGEAEAGSNL